MTAAPLRTHNRVAAPLEWETATLEDLLDLAAESGIQAGLLYRAIHHDARVDAERVGKP